MRPSHRKPARFAKEIPDQNFLGERHVPVEHVPGLPAPRQWGPGAGRLTSPAAPRGHPRASHPRGRRLTFATAPSAGPNKTCPGLLIPRVPGGGGWGVISGDSRKVSPSRALGRVPGERAARWADPSRRAGARSRQGGRRERTHLGEEVVHCSRALPDLPESRVRLAEVSPADGPGKPCVSRRDSQEPEPAGLPRCHGLTRFSSFAPFVCPNPSL